MKLVELDLDAPKHPRRLEFRRRTRCVTALIERHLRVVTTKKIWKLMVECYPSGSVRPHVRNLIGVLAVGCTYDVDAHLALSDGEQRLACAELLRAGAVEAAPAVGWPTDVLDDAIAAAAGAGFLNRWTHAAKWNSGRTLKASVECSHEPDTFTAKLVVQDAQGRQAVNVTILEADPDELIFVPRLGALKWLTRDAVSFASKDGSNEQTWTCAPTPSA